MKKLLSLALAALLATGMATTVLAADYGGSSDGGSASTPKLSAAGSAGAGAATVVSTASVTKAIASTGSVSITSNAVASKKVMETVSKSTTPVTFTAPGYTLQIDPKTVTQAKDISLSVQTSDVASEATFTEYFSNKIASVKFAQKGDFGARVKVTVKPANLSKLNTATLNLYTYNPATNSYRSMSDPFVVNADGSITFSTTVGNSLIISEGPLRLK